MRELCTTKHRHRKVLVWALLSSPRRSAWPLTQACIHSETHTASEESWLLAHAAGRKQVALPKQARKCTHAARTRSAYTSQAFAAPPPGHREAEAPMNGRRPLPTERPARASGPCFGHRQGRHGIDIVGMTPNQCRLSVVVPSARCRTLQARSSLERRHTDAAGPLRRPTHRDRPTESDAPGNPQARTNRTRPGHVRAPAPHRRRKGGGQAGQHPPGRKGVAGDRPPQPAEAEERRPSGTNIRPAAKA